MFMLENFKYLEYLEDTFTKQNYFYGNENVFVVVWD